MRGPPRPATIVRLLIRSAPASGVKRRGSCCFHPLPPQYYLLQPRLRGLATNAPQSSSGAKAPYSTSSNSSSGSSASPVGGDEEVQIYTGPHGDVIRTLKRVSLTTCVIGILSTPAFIALGAESVPFAGNLFLTSIVLLATTGPTFLLHAFSSPYIFRLYRSPAQAETLRAETMNFITRTQSTSFNLSDVKPLPNALRPFVTFQAKGKLYFVHGEQLSDKALLRKLVGRPLKPEEM